MYCFSDCQRKNTNKKFVNLSMANETYGALNKAWKSTCRIVFGGEVGELNDFEDWLRTYTVKPRITSCALSGKPVSAFVKDYSASARFVSFDELNFGAQPQVSINDVKDLESLASSLGEHAFYCGNLVLGNSKYVEKSSNITDCFYVYETDRVSDSKYVAYCTLGRFGECVFGVNGIGESNYCILCNETYRNRRCFEAWLCQNCSDCYYSYGLQNCSDCLFCFNLKGKKYAIGNRELPRENYLEAKQKILAQMRSKLAGEKILPSLVGLVPELRQAPVLESHSSHAVLSTNLNELELAFQKTSGVLFQKTLSGLEDYAPWLRKHTHDIFVHESALSKKPVVIGDYCSLALAPRSRLVTEEEGYILGEKTKIPESDALSLSLENVSPLLDSIAFFYTEYHTAGNENMIEVPCSHESAHGYRAFPLVYSKYSAYSFWPRSSEYTFGCNSTLESCFCMNTYYSMKLKRCFEVDSSRDCSDLCFSHNCENVHDSMFCFNAKNLSHAIAGTKFAPEKYAQLKKGLLEQISQELEKNKSLKWDVYTLLGK